MSIVFLRTRHVWFHLKKKLMQVSKVVNIIITSYIKQAIKSNLQIFYYLWNVFSLIFRCQCCRTIDSTKIKNFSSKNIFFPIMFDSNENFKKLIEENKNLIFSKLSVETCKLGNDHSCTNVQKTKLAKFTLPPHMPKQVLNQMITSLSRNTTLMQVTRNL